MKPSEGFSVLVVDDTPELRRLQVHILEKAGYHVDSATTGQECLDYIARKKPDLLLLDVVLPDISGVDICKQIKADPDLAGIFILLISAWKTDTGEMAEGLETGADGYIPRPLGDRELLARIDAASRTIKSERALREKDAIFSDIFQTITEGIAYTSPKGIVLAVNRALVELIEIPENELVGHHIVTISGRILSPSMIKLVVPFLNNIILGKKIPAFEVSYKNKVLEVRNFQNPTTKHITGVIQDITERKRSEKALQANMNQIKKINDLLVGRELKMIELKKEVNSLLRLLGKPEKYVIAGQTED